ncbi:MULTISPECIES: tyrosine-type recombinase/integrase [unclassified Halomonas]|uniref:tyrosine-type recombinase/integrase n=1 Tax=unclassified Halomonas TaxID=2609666 RepID=UPI00055615A4|nr:MULTISPECIES: site-specific integrase [unclassified Halomonas]CEP36164.1 Tyrosine recombinase xerC [Halomonas sp. R57-5]
MANNVITPTDLLLPLNTLPNDGRISAQNDAQAVMAWLEEYVDSPQTWKAYRRESERLLLWLASQGLTLADINRETLRQFEAFLTDPQPCEQWVGPSKPRSHPAWKPFRGVLSPASRRQSLVILQGMFAWLVEAGWVNHNPFRLMRDKSRRLNNQTPRIERYLESDLWAWLWTWLNTPLAAGEGSRARFEHARRRFIFGFAYLLAPRISEMADARMGDFQRSEGRWWWHVVGKGSKMARIPLPEDMLNCLQQWRQALGLPDTHSQLETAMPLLRALDGQRGLGHNQLYRLIRETFQQAAQALEASGGAPEHIAALHQATPHWLRHTSITHQAQSGISLRHLAESARHARLDTTSRYLHSEDAEWHREQQRHRLNNSLPDSSLKPPLSRYNEVDS